MSKASNFYYSSSLWVRNSRYGFFAAPIWPKCNIPVPTCLQVGPVHLHRRNLRLLSSSDAPPWKQDSSCASMIFAIPVVPPELKEVWPRPVWSSRKPDSCPLLRCTCHWRSASCCRRPSAIFVTGDRWLCKRLWCFGAGGRGVGLPSCEAVGSI